MVAAPRHLKRAARAAAWAAAALALVIALFALAAWIGSSIPRNGDWREPENGVEILVETNGVHTALILPLTTMDKDWRADFPACETIRLAEGHGFRFMDLRMLFERAALDPPSTIDQSGCLSRLIKLYNISAYFSSAE